MSTWRIKQIWGGLAEAEQVDREATFSFGKNINYRRTHDLITLNQRMSKDSGTTVDALPHWIKDLRGTVYAYCANGKIFQRFAAASWVSQKTVSASTGQGLGVDASYLYYVNASFIGRFPIGGTWGASNIDNFQTITACSWNPVRYFANVDLTLFGSKNNVAVWDPGASNYSGTRLTMPAGWQVRDFEEWGDYMAISLWTGANIRSSSRGLLALWDGLSETINALIDSNDGNILCAQTDKNNLNVFAGVIGNIYRVEGGQLIQKRKIPFINEDSGNNIDIYPGAKANWKGIPHFGVAGAATGASLYRGVYSFGTNKNNVPGSMNMEYTISEDASDSTVLIGSLHTASDNEFYVGWGHSATFGIDKLDQSNQYSTGFFETLQNHGTPTEEGYIKVPDKVHMMHHALTSGMSIVYKVMSDFSASFATVVTSSTTGMTDVQASQLAAGTAIPMGRVFKGRVDLTSVNGVAPELISIKTDLKLRPTS